MLNVIFQSCNQIFKNNKQYSKVLNQVRSPWSKIHDKHFRIKFILRIGLFWHFSFYFIGNVSRTRGAFLYKPQKEGKLLNILQSY